MVVATVITATVKLLLEDKISTRVGERPWRRKVNAEGREIVERLAYEGTKGGIERRRL